MSNLYGVNGSASVSYPPAADAGMTVMSPDSLLEYCQMQLSGLDGQITDQMNSQRTQLRERQAVQSAQTVLEQFGTAGPQNPTEFQKCVDALNGAIKQLPQGDPVAGQLADFRDQMCKKFGFTPAQPLTSAEEMRLILDDTASSLRGNAAATADATALRNKQDGTLTHPPDKDAHEWQGTTDGIANMISDIKTNSEIEMLSLQDLVSQRQQAIQLASGMMSKTDETLGDLAKAIGR